MYKVLNKDIIEDEILPYPVLTLMEAILLP